MNNWCNIISLLLCILGCKSQMIVPNLNNNYLLAENEHYTIFLDDFFAGDNLNYSITPSTGVSLANPNISILQSLGIPINCLGPDYLFLYQLIPVSESTKIYFIYNCGSMLVVYYLYRDVSDIISKSKVEFNSTILQYQVCYVNTIGIFVITSEPNSDNSQVNKLFFVYDELNSPEIAPLETTDIENFNSETIYISKGYLNDTLLITGYLDETPTIIIYALGEFLQPYKILQLNISIENVILPLPLLLAVTFGDIHYIYVAQSQKIIKISTNTFGLIQVKELKLDILDSVASSMTLTQDWNNIILGISTGFIVFSLDLEQMYIKSFTTNSKVSVSSTLTGGEGNLFAFVRNDTSTTIQVTSQDIGFYILGELNLDPTANYIGWSVISPFLDYFVLVYADEVNMTVSVITLSSGTLTLNGTGQEMHYSLVVSGSSMSEVWNFTVSPYTNVGSVLSLNSSKSLEAVFTGMSSVMNFKVGQYFIGYNLTLSSNISIQYESPNYSSLFTMTNQSVSSTDLIPAFVTPDGFKYQGILTDTFGNLILYNSTNALLITGKTTEVYYFSNQISNLLQCGKGYVLDFKSNTIDNLSYTENLKETGGNLTTHELDCKLLKCSDSFLVCGNSSTLWIFNSFPLNSTPAAILSSTVPSVSFTDFYIYTDTFLGLIMDTTEIIIYDLDILTSNKSDRFVMSVILNSTLSNPGKLILASDTQIYILTQNQSLDVYNLELNYSKGIPLSSKSVGQVELIDDTIVIFGEILTVVNGLAFVSEAVIAQRPYGGFCSLVASCSMTLFQLADNLSIYILNSTQVDLVKVPSDLNTIYLSFNISDSTRIDSISYSAFISFNVSNQFNYQQANIPLTLYVNGQTIFVNTTELQSSDIRITCGTQATIPLDNIFLGQDLDVNVTSKDIVQYEHRFNQTSNEYIKTQLDYVRYSDFIKLYIGTKDCSVFVLNLDFNITSGPLEFNNSENIVCICGSIAEVYRNDTLITAVGCSYTRNITEIGSDDSSTFLSLYILNFVMYGFEELTFLYNFTLNYAPDKIFAVSQVSGGFVLLAADVYSNANTAGFYSNHLTVLQGTVSPLTYMLNVTYVNPSVISVPYYYISDFTGIYDPIFETYYLYIVDIFYGLRIIEMNSDFSLTISRPGIPQINTVSVAVCGQYLYLANTDTQIKKFYLRNWNTLSFISSVFPYMGNFKSIPGTLSCSDYTFAQYLLLLMTDSMDSTYIHLIDNLAPELSSIITDYEIASYPSIAIVEFIGPQNVIAVTSFSYSTFLVSPFQVSIFIEKNCTEITDEKVSIWAYNKISYANVSINFTLEKNYSPGNVNAKILPLYVWVIIGASFLILAAISIFITRRCSQWKNRRSLETELFNFEFMEDE